MGSIHPELALNLLRWKESEKFEVTVYHEIETRPVSSAQNAIVNQFLKSNSEYLLLLEADVIAPPNRICPHSSLDLIEFDVDIVDGLCFVCERGAPFIGKVAAASRFRGEQCLSLSEEELFPPQLIEVDCTGAGCLMVKRKVLENLKPPFFQFELNESGEEAIVTQDYYFSLKAKRAGFHIYIHSGFLCIHEVVVGI